MSFSNIARVREIIDANGPRLRLSIERHALETLVRLERMDLLGKTSATLDVYGTELLCGFVVAARLTNCDGLADERVEGPHGAIFSITSPPDRRIEIRQGTGRTLSVPASLWDRLFAELCIVSAHGRGFASRFPSRALH